MQITCASYARLQSEAEINFRYLIYVINAALNVENARL